MGCSVIIKKKICTAETYGIHERIGYFHPIQTYYLGELKEKVSEPTEEGNEPEWFEYEDLKGKMYLEMQNWALEQCFEK